MYFLCMVVCCALKVGCACGCIIVVSMLYILSFVYNRVCCTFVLVHVCAEVERIAYNYMYMWLIVVHTWLLCAA